MRPIPPTIQIIIGPEITRYNFLSAYEGGAQAYAAFNTTGVTQYCPYGAFTTEGEEWWQGYRNAEDAENYPSQSFTA